MNKEEYWNKYNSFDLCRHFNKDFDIWWDSDRFNWYFSSDVLCEYIPDKFDIWWDSNEFGWKYGSQNLCNYILHKIIIWWNIDKFDWEKQLKQTKFLSNIEITPHEISKKLTINFVKTYINNLEWDYD